MPHAGDIDAKDDASRVDARVAPARMSFILPALFIGVGVFRLAECSALPAQTNDIMRHLYTGLMLLGEGPGALKVPLAEWRPVLDGRIPWPRLPYNYPALAVAFTTWIAALWPSMFFFKLVLTGFEACNAWLVHRVTGDRVLALLYWVSPVSISWVSREGQFEPLQNFFVLLAFLCLRTRPALAPAMLVLAFQAKMSALLLAPWFLLKWWQLDERDRVRAVLFAMAALAPTVILALLEPASLGVLRVRFPVDFNLWYLNPFDKNVVHDAPDFLLVWNAITSTLYLGVLIWLAVRRKSLLPYITAIAFMVLARITPHFLFWYFLVLPTFLLTIEDPRERRWLIAGVMILEIGGVLGLGAAWLGALPPIWGTEGYFSWQTLTVPERW